VALAGVTDEAVVRNRRAMSSAAEWLQRCTFIVSSSLAESEAHSIAYSRLQRLRELPSNWNGYGAEPIDPGIQSSAQRVLDKLALGGVGAPQVVPMTHGRLQLEWHKGNRSLELEFESCDSIRFLKWDSDNRIQDEDSIATTELDAINALIRWFGAR
jgi:hypothetical protein